jgi:hypothetical protein
MAVAHQYNTLCNLLVICFSIFYPMLKLGHLFVNSVMLVSSHNSYFRAI